MAFGDALLGIQDQLVPSQGIGGFLSQTTPFDPNAIQPVQGAGVQQLPIPLPDTAGGLRQAPTQLTPENSKRVKGIGKFISNLGDVLADPATQKALGAIGISLDPRGVGGVLGGLGIDLAEANARDQFREAVAAGGDPNQIAISGLSPEGRLQETSALQQSQTFAAKEEQRDIENQQAERKIDLQERQIEVSEGNLSARQLEIEESVFTRERRDELAQEQLKLDASRTKFQNIRDLASAKASEALAGSREEGEIVDVNKQRVALLEETSNQKTELLSKLRKAQQVLDTAESNTTGFRASVRRGISASLGGDKTSEDVQETAQARAVVATLERQISELDLMQNQVVQDFQKDLAGRSGFKPVTIVQAQQQEQTQVDPDVELLVARTLDEFNKIPDNTPFFMPDPQTKRPIKVVKVNGKARRIE